MKNRKRTEREQKEHRKRTERAHLEFRSTFEKQKGGHEEEKLKRMHTVKSIRSCVTQLSVKVYAKMY